MSGERFGPSEQWLVRARRRYLSLGLGELTTVALGIIFGLSVFRPYFPGPGETVAMWSALAPLLIILVHAGVYWLIARARLDRAVGGSNSDGHDAFSSPAERRASAPLPRWFARRTRYTIGIHPALLLAGLGGIIANVPDHPFAIGIVVVLWILGVLEYINYFVVRISYPWLEWMGEVGKRRTPRLIKDLRASLG